MKKKIDEAAREKQVRAATAIIGDELRLAYNISFCIDILFNDIAGRITSVGGFKFEKKQRFTTFTQKVKEALIWYEKCGFDDDFMAATDGDYSKLDGYRQDANELIRVLMLYIDRTTTTAKYEEIIKYLTEQPEGGIFSQEEIDRFNFVAKCRLK